MSLSSEKFHKISKDRWKDKEHNQSGFSSRKDFQIDQGKRQGSKKQEFNPEKGRKDSWKERHRSNVT